MEDNDFAISIRRAISQYQKSGYEIRPLTKEEAHTQADTVESTKQLQLPVSVRLKQIRRVNEVVVQMQCTKLHACELVGIKYGLYKELSRKHRAELNSKMMDDA